MQQSTPFTQAFRGSFTGILRWHQLDELWETLRKGDTDNWYIYAVGEESPEQASSSEDFLHFLVEIDKLLRTEHDKDYCGIVYVDDRTSPGFIKIFDPNNLGVSCGFSNNPPLPGWTLTRMKPENLDAMIDELRSR